MAEVVIRAAIPEASRAGFNGLLEAGVGMRTRMTMTPKTTRDASEDSKAGRHMANG